MNVMIPIKIKKKVPPSRHVTDGTARHGRRQHGATMARHVTGKLRHGQGTARHAHSRMSVGSEEEGLAVSWRRILRACETDTRPAPPGANGAGRRGVPRIPFRTSLYDRLSSGIPFILGTSTANLNRMNKKS